MGILNWFNILIDPSFPIHIRGLHKRNKCLCIPLGCTVHYLACPSQPRENTGMGKVFTFDCLGWSNIVQVRMLWNWCHHCTTQFIMLGIL